MRHDLKSIKGAYLCHAIKEKMNKKQFNAFRVKEALQYRAKSMTELAQEIGVSKQAMSQYVNGESVPKYENILKIAYALQFPYEYFMSEDYCSTVTGKTYFRSLASATKKLRNSQKIKLEYATKLYNVLLDYVDFPDLNLPDVISYDDYSAEMDQFEYMEDIARNVRECWGLGTGPIENFQYVLEKNGIIVTGFNGVDNKIDAFSQIVTTKDKKTSYIIALALGEKSQERLLFDMAHELGHILLHKWGEDEEDLSKEEFNKQERQANMFASALLLPRESFSESIKPYPLELEHYIQLKKKWHVSMQAMMYRACQLDVITANQFQYLMRKVSAKGWRKWEPGDNRGKLNSTIFQGAIDLLVEGKYLTVRELIKSFEEYGMYLRVEDLEDLMGLKKDTLTEEKIDTAVIKLKTKNESFS